MREAEKLRELAAWYREFAERAGNQSIWESRLLLADLQQEADAWTAMRLKLAASACQMTASPLLRADLP